MNSTLQLFERQAAWQKSRARLSWPDKIRQAETLREALVEWRRSRDSRKPQSPTTERTDRKSG
jgi:hypothetical protein